MIVERCPLVGDTLDVLATWTEALPQRAQTRDDRGVGMTMPPASRRTIEEELGLQATKVELGLQSELLPIPVGADDRFLVRRALGRGSMGTVYLAEDLRMKREVALKVVASRRVEHGHLEKRLEREAQALAALRHENVVQAFDLAWTEAGELFIAMEYVPGRNLRAWQAGSSDEAEEEAPRSFDEILDVYLSAGRGLAGAHAAGIVHRDFKPDNVFIDERPERRRVLVGDFGLAGAEPGTAAPRRAVQGVLTSTRGVLGTLAYMAPEQLRGEQADARSDQHQFCVALWEALTRTRPFADEGRSERDDEPLPPRPQAIPRWLHPVLVQGLSFVSEDRFPSMVELIEALERRRRRRRALPWMVGAGLMAIAGVSAVHGLQTDPCAAADSAIVGSWTPDVRTEIDAAIREQGASYSPGLANFVVETLDHAASEGGRRAREVCEARVEAPVSDRRLEQRQTCLERWARRFERRVGLLREERADAAVLERAHDLVAPLRDPGGECQIPPIPIVVSVQEAIEHSEELALLGAKEVARVEAERAVEVAVAEGRACQSGGGEDASGRPYSSELAAALYRLGVIQRADGGTRESMQTLAQAHVHALACDDGHRFVDARTHAAKIATVDLGTLDDATQALEEASVQIARLELPEIGPRRYEHWKALGLLAEQRGDHERAREHYDAGLEALGEPEQHPIEAAKLLHDIGITFQNEGRYTDASETHARSLAVMSGALGAEHPAVRALAAKQALTAGHTAVEHSRYDVARAQFEVAARSGSPRVDAMATIALAQSELQAGATDRARRACDALLGLVDSHDDLPPAIVANAVGTAGQVFGELGEPRSLELLTRAQALWTAQGKADNAQITRFHYALALQQLGRDDDSRRALDALKAEPGVLDGPLAEPVAVLDEQLDQRSPEEPTEP